MSRKIPETMTRTEELFLNRPKFHQPNYKYTYECCNRCMRDIHGTSYNSTREIITHHGQNMMFINPFAKKLQIPRILPGCQKALAMKEKSHKSYTNLNPWKTRESSCGQLSHRHSLPGDIDDLSQENWPGLVTKVGRGGHLSHCVECQAKMKLKFTEKLDTAELLRQCSIPCKKKIPQLPECCLHRAELVATHGREGRSGGCWHHVNEWMDHVGKVVAVIDDADVSPLDKKGGILTSYKAQVPYGDYKTITHANDKASKDP
ncbi:uncharacterized protein LOC121382145 isoform X2 [Gigantopelta aegis]|uniref:uncharacterized protein LOC121382145 isoform X2 n=1 Tax=Gigantopelta aegis TaxID=1735272 RepID=UPI001B88C953|nr:uncharacterized protein LOC121382145 isoform X2 [Gigantopelta aegis]